MFCARNVYIRAYFAYFASGHLVLHTCRQPHCSGALTFEQSGAEQKRTHTWEFTTRLLRKDATSRQVSPCLCFHVDRRPFLFVQPSFLFNKINISFYFCVCKVVFVQKLESVFIVIRTPRPPSHLLLSSGPEIPPKRLSGPKQRASVHSMW